MKEPFTVNFLNCYLCDCTNGNLLRITDKHWNKTSLCGEHLLN